MWIGIRSNAADHPSRNAPLPRPGPIPDWLQRAYDEEPTQLAQKGSRKGCPGLARVSRVPPVEVPRGVNVRDKAREWQVRFEKIGWSANADFREYYSGCGRLSSAVARSGVPVRYPKEGYRESHDMSLKHTLTRKLRMQERVKQPEPTSASFAAAGPF